MLSPFGVHLEDNHGFVEVGLMFEGRPIRISMIGPPMMPYYQGHIRVHPRKPLTLSDLTTTIPPMVTELLQKIIQAGHGLLIVGDNGVGKTTLYASLFADVPVTRATALLERTAEISPLLIPKHFVRYLFDEENHLRSFEAQLDAAMSRRLYQTIFMDEIRGDEQGAFWRLLTHDTKPQIITSFRGRGITTRLYSGVTMAIRKADRTLLQADIDHALLERLPFVVVLSYPMPNLPPRFVQLAQWIPSDSGLVLEPLIVWEADSEPQLISSSINYLLG
jgi:Flp pilus assembly CpaF family ATPase